MSAGERDFSIKSLWGSILGSRSNLDDKAVELAHEYTGLIVEEPEEIDMDPRDLKLQDLPRHSESRGEETRRWANNMRELHRHHRQRSSEWRASVASDGTLIHSDVVSPRGSHHSDDTLQELAALELSPGKYHQDKVSRWRRIGHGAFATTERVLVFLGYMQVLTGLATYSGICRDNYINVCLAHLISASHIPVAMIICADLIFRQRVVFSGATASSLLHVSSVPSPTWVGHGTLLLVRMETIA